MNDSIAARFVLVDTILILILVAQMVMIAILIRWTYLIQKMLDFSREDESVREATEDIKEARKNLPPRLTPNQKDK